jgi:hypothetical protein
MEFHITCLSSGRDVTVTIDQISNYGLYVQPVNEEDYQQTPYFLIFKDPDHNGNTWILIEETDYGAKVINTKLTLTGLKEAIQILCKTYRFEINNWNWLDRQLQESWELE